jgi:uncharacterized damage-inducible protein DinB
MASKMMEPLVEELRHEGGVTRRVLDQVPEALHIATTPGAIVRLATPVEFDATGANFVGPEPASKKEIIDAHETSMRDAVNYLSALSDADAMTIWSLKMHGKERLRMPRVGLVRSIMMNHCYHHRGQLSVYLRMMQVKVPSIYGPSADESPFD